MMKKPKQNSRAVVAMLALLASGPGVQRVQAASPAGDYLDVQVMDRASGRVLSDVSVCLGTAADTKQFGGLKTDDRGMVRFQSVPRSPLQVTVSKPGYQGQLRRLAPQADSRSVIMKLAAGWRAGPRCALQARPASGNKALSISSLDLVPVTGRHVVEIDTRVEGDPAQIRISENRDFSGARWLPYQPSVSHQLSTGKGRKRLFVQVRRLARVNGASLQALSPVVSAEIRLP